MLARLRKRIEKSDRIAALLGWLLALYLRFCRATGHWQVEGLDDMRTDLANGPVVGVFWHGRLMLSSLAWPKEYPIAAPRDPSPAGQLSAATQRHLNTQSFEIPAKKGGVAALRPVLAMTRDGFSLGLTGDGPKGPNQVVKRAVIDWIRATGVPVYSFAWSGPAFRLKTWDNLMIPKPFGGGVLVYRRWEITIPRRPSEDEYQELADGLAQQLSAIADEADQLAKR